MRLVASPPGASIEPGGEGGGGGSFVRGGGGRWPGSAAAPTRANPAPRGAPPSAERPEQRG